MEDLQSPSPLKRQNFTENNDLVLLCQVVADLPFVAMRGRVMEAWDAVVDRILLVPTSLVRTMTGKTAQARFKQASRTSPLARPGSAARIRG